MTNDELGQLGDWIEQRTAEPQNVEVWNRCALSFELIKIDRIPYFDIRHSVFAFFTGMRHRNE